MALKQVIVVRADLKMPKGKLAVQVAHASVESVLEMLKTNKEIIERWKKTGMKKSVVKVNSLEELLNIKKIAKKENIKVVMIKDAAKTFFKEPTITCIALGPDEEEKIDKITGNLKLV